jgi:putative SOS response-associated peptidase YedK
MCGRLWLEADYFEIKVRLGVGDFYALPNVRASWNIAPTQDVLCIILDAATGQRKPVKMQWGLIPRWAKTSKMEYPTFNARADTLTEKPTFRDAWKGGRRCLIVTDGFYEWRKGDKQPFAIAGVDGDLTVMAGLWDEWVSPEGEVILSCTVLTTEPNELMSPIHHRMPVILAPADWPAWLGEVPATKAELRALLRPFPADKMKLWPVDKRVGNVRTDDAGLVTEVPLPPPPEESQPCLF